MNLLSDTEADFFCFNKEHSLMYDVRENGTVGGTEIEKRKKVWNY